VYCAFFVITNYIWVCWWFVIVGKFMAEVCDCGGKMKQYSANVRVCQKCKKIPNIDTLIELLQEMGAKEETLKSLKKDLHFSPV
jgi:hypothetical protein